MFVLCLPCSPASQDDIKINFSGPSGRRDVLGVASGHNAQFPLCAYAVSVCVQALLLRIFLIRLSVLTVHFKRSLKSSASSI